MLFFCLLVAGLPGAPVAAKAGPPAFTPVDPPAAPGASAPNLTRAGGTVIATWLERIDAPASAPPRHRLQTASLGKSGWGPPRTITSGEDLLANWADVPALTVGGDGAWFASWPRQVAGAAEASEVALARSTDGGRTWTRLGPAHDDHTPTEHGFAAWLPERTGALLAWLDGRHAGAMSLRVGGVGAGPTSVRASEVVDARVCDCCATAAAQTADGPIVVYRDRSETEIRDLAIVRRVKGVWTPPAAVARDDWQMPGCPVNGPSVAAEGRRVAVAWFTAPGGQARVQVAFSTDSGASFGAPILVDGEQPLGRVSLALTGRDEAVVSWMTAAGTVRLRRVTAAGRLGAPLDLVTLPPAKQSGFPRLATVGQSAVVLFTEPGTPSRVRGLRVRLDAVPAASAGVPNTSAAPPGIPLKTLDGAPFERSNLRGRVVLLNLWATWCAPCRRELPALAGLHTRFTGRGLEVLGQNVDEDADAVARFLAAHPLPYRVVRGATPLPAGFVVPTTWLLDTDGNVLWRQVGPVPDDPAALAALIEAALPKAH